MGPPRPLFRLPEVRDARSPPERRATARRIGFSGALVQKRGRSNRTGALEVRELLVVYLCGVVLLLTVSTSIEGEEGVGLDHILIAAFGWPVIAPALAFRAWTSR